MAITRTEIPSLESLRDKIVNDIRRLKIRAGITRPNVALGSESAVKAEAYASAVLELYAKVAALQDATMPDAAEGDDLARLADVLKGLKASVGAGASGNVIAACSGSVTYAVGQQCTTPDGLRYEVVITTLASNGDPVPIRGIDVGKRTDKDAATIVTWSSPPSGSDVTAIVDSGKLTGGKDADNDARLRARLQSAMRHPAASGSWADFAGWAEGASASIEKAFVYPAVQGPGTVHVAVLIPAIEDTYYTREASASLVNTAALAIVAKNPEHADVLTTAGADEDVNVVLTLSLPAHRVDGGPGGGWLNEEATRWPANGTTPTYATRLSAAPVSGTVIRVTTYAAPVAGAYIAIWSTSNKRFEHSRIKSATLVGGAVYELTLYTAIDTSIIASGDYVSPDAENLDDYGKTLAQTFATLGPGEKTSTAALLPRAYRHPLNTDSWNSAFTSKHIGQISILHDEVSHVGVSVPATLPSTPTVTTSVTDPPNVLRIGLLALYPA